MFKSNIHVIWSGSFPLGLLVTLRRRRCRPFRVHFERNSFFPASPFPLDPLPPYCPRNFIRRHNMAFYRTSVLSSVREIISSVRITRPTLRVILFQVLPRSWLSNSSLEGLGRSPPLFVPSLSDLNFSHCLCLSLPSGFYLQLIIFVGFDISSQIKYPGRIVFRSNFGIAAIDRASPSFFVRWLDHSNSSHGFFWSTSFGIIFSE